MPPTRQGTKEVMASLSRDGAILCLALFTPGKPVPIHQPPTVGAGNKLWSWLLRFDSWSPSHTFTMHIGHTSAHSACFVIAGMKKG